jgi:hypothetical protein
MDTGPPKTDQELMDGLSFGDVQGFRQHVGKKLSNGKKARFIWGINVLPRPTAMNTFAPTHSNL